MASNGEAPETPTVDLPTMVTLDPRGDIILSMTLKKSYKIRVSSKVLGMASPVFDAMFDGRFIEGQQLSATAPKEIDLPDDDGHSMYLLCRMLYRSLDLEGLRKPNLQDGDPWPWSARSNSLVKVTVVANKYLCVKALEYEMKSVIFDELLMSKLRTHPPLAPVVGSMDGDLDMWFDFLAIAYQLKDRNLFWEMSDRVVRALDEDQLLTLVDSIPLTSGLLDPIIFVYLDAKRREVFTAFVSSMEDILHKKDLMSHDPCIWRKATSHYTIWRHEATNFQFPFHDGSPDILHIMRTWTQTRKSLNDLYMYLHIDIERYDSENHAKESAKRTPMQAAFLNVIRTQLKEFEDLDRRRLNGLCLLCFKNRSMRICSCNGDHSKKRKAED